MSELKRDANFQVNAASPAARGIPGSGESQTLRAGESQRTRNQWANDSDAGCDPYNSTGIRAFRRHTT